MILSFHIEYRTNWGEEVRILGSVPELGSWEEGQTVPLQTVDGTNWNISKEIQCPTDEVVKYTYYIYKDGEPVRKEWDSFPRQIHVSSNENIIYRNLDAWKNIPKKQFFYSSAFTECLLARKRGDKQKRSYKKTLVIKAYAPQISSNFALAISGNQPSLGNWDVSKVCVMNDSNFPEWQVAIDADQLTFPLEYKFVLYNLKEEKVEAWENNPNRYQADPLIKDEETVQIADRYVYFDLPFYKATGVAIPVFSLKSKQSFGVGDFSDLKMMIDWAVNTNQKLVQILPINDTTMTHTWKDSYPYNSISIYAFHPMYADVYKMGKLNDPEKMAYFTEKQVKLNTKSTVDYEAVNQAKWEYFRLIFQQEGKMILKSEAFMLFLSDNLEWLQPYAVFSYLRDQYNTPNFREWPQCSTFNQEEIESLCQPESKDFEEIAIYFYIQYHLHLQLLEASTYARQKGVVLKGDIPIGISRNSVEAWKDARYFNLNGQAGAPPDDFSANGQNWGFPTYNWDVMEKDGYSWWMKRFQKMSEYFDAYRIDHILGFFRIWEIPLDAVHGLLGQFVPSLPMSPEEIENCGLPFNEDFYTKPYIHESFLQQIFGPHTEYIKETFIRTTSQWEIYEMRPEFDTQKKVQAYFSDKTDSDNIWIRDGLYALISDVLFVRDRKNPTMYHPRIAVQFDFIFQTLNDNDKAVFNKLYDNYYYHRHNNFWQQQAMKKLPQLVRSTRMLVCGEDLGMIPDCVPWVMNELQILSLEIQRMPKSRKLEFGHVGDYPYSSVCTISSHDMSTLRGWWQEDYQQTQRYFNNILGHYGAAPEKASGTLCEEVVKQHLYSNSILCVLTLQDWLSISEEWRNPNIEAERINIPANPRHYWRYRMHLSLEDLMQADSINTKIRELIVLTGRNPEK
ncbi:4-alpha-glucanotransferase [uncultured Bacteroides sp.]|uniref:4-alpha-glucanotransferase n=1 Tax=uncultured Bacteroides sp. TaxID=162156 RepID=UPI002AAC1BE5|nr:4-alpha-glucanotransferase [uncultured Bacteroides sp.]